MMLLSRLKPLDEIYDQLKNSKAILLLACNGCEESFGNSSPERLRYLAAEMEKMGATIAETTTVDFLCEPLLVRHWLEEMKHKVAFDAILAVSCGIGVQVVSKVATVRTYPACDTVTMGGRFGQPWGKEKCRECGQCILPFTGGICPLTACSKGLLNGPCGGSQNGRCEVYPETRECGWHLIYERLEALGLKDLLMGEALVKDFSKSEPPEELIELQSKILSMGDETL